MVHHNPLHFTSAAEVSIFSRKEIVGALRNIIVCKIPCLENQAGDFCLDADIGIQIKKIRFCSSWRMSFCFSRTCGSSERRPRRSGGTSFYSSGTSGSSERMPRRSGGTSFYSIGMSGSCEGTFRRSNKTTNIFNKCLLSIT